MNGAACSIEGRGPSDKIFRGHVGENHETKFKVISFISAFMAVMTGTLIAGSFLGITRLTMETQSIISGVLVVSLAFYIVSTLRSYLSAGADRAVEERDELGAWNRQLRVNVQNGQEISRNFAEQEKTVNEVKKQLAILKKRIEVEISELEEAYHELQRKHIRLLETKSRHDSSATLHGLQQNLSELSSQLAQNNESVHEDPGLIKALRDVLIETLTPFLQRMEQIAEGPGHESPSSSLPTSGKKTGVSGHNSYPLYKSSGEENPKPKTTSQKIPTTPVSAEDLDEALREA